MMPETPAQEPVKKSRIKKALITLGAAALAYFGADYIIRNHTGGSAYSAVSASKCEHDHNENLDESLSKLATTKNQDCMMNTSINAINKTAKAGHSAIMLNELGNLQTVDNIGKETARFPALVHKSSPAWKKLSAQLGEDAQFAEQNIDWLVFTPNIPNRKGGEEGGLSAGKKVIYIDTMAQDGTIRDPIEYAPIIAHEAQHEADKGLSGILKKEKNAHERQLKTAQNLLKANKKETLQGMINECAKRIQTASYLEKLGDFDNTYPMSTILAEALLNAGINSRTLKKYHNVNTGNAELDAELSAASKCASIVHDYNLYNATKKLHEIASTGAPMEKVSAASALSWLYPALNKSKNTAGWHSSQSRGAGFNFGEGTGEPSTGCSVANLPPLEEFLKDARAEDRSLLGRLFGKQKQGTYEEKDRDVDIKQAAAKGQLESVLEEMNEQYRNIRGPLPGFTYRGYYSQGAGTLVIWQNDSYKEKGKYPLTKQDKYLNGEFQHAVINFIDKYREQDIEKNPPMYFPLKEK